MIEIDLDKLKPFIPTQKEMSKILEKPINDLKEYLQNIADEQFEEIQRGLVIKSIYYQHKGIEQFKRRIKRSKKRINKLQRKHNKLWK